MTHVINTFAEIENNIEKIYGVEIVTFDGEIYNAEVLAYNADEAQQLAAEMYNDVDYTSILYCE